jgi:hypothetical protein
MRPQNIYKLCMSVICIFLLTIGFSYGYEVETHSIITDNAFKQSVATNDFITAIGYRPTDTLAKGSKVFKVQDWAREWAKEGSIKEDETFTSDVGGENFRYVHHFFDPVSNRGLDFNLAIAGYGYYHVMGNKAPDWALEDNERFPKQFYSIQHAKEYYFAGLTASTKDEREASLAKTFKTLGQVLHILQDMAQPQHTRNDPHGGDIFSTPYGSQMFGEKSRYELYVNDPKKINTFDYAPAYPVSFDTYRKFYISADGKGMSTFSNRNFVTEGTNFTCTLANCQGATGGGYANPVLDVATQYDVAANQLEDVPPSVTGNVTFFRNTFTDNYSGQTITNDRVTTYSLFDRDLKSKGKSPAFTLNRANYKVMANLLLPRAVGYSAGLLNYFFRGQLGVTFVPGGLKVKNLSSETMTSYTDTASGTTYGTIEVYYDAITDSTKNPPTTERRHLASYSLSSLQTQQLAPGEETPAIPFTAPPDNVKQNQYMVVFRGKLGNEEGAVIGQIVRSYVLYYGTQDIDGVDRIYKINPDGSNQTLVFDNPSRFLLGKFSPSPDGKTLAISISTDNTVLNSYILLLNLSDNTISPNIIYGDWPDWSPDSKKIVFNREVSPNPASSDVEIFTIDLTTPETPVERQLTFSSAVNLSSFNPAWSPDSNTIAYTMVWSQQPEPGCFGFWGISLMSSSDGTQRRSLICPDHISGDDEAAWSPDGSQVAFIRQQHDDWPLQLYKVDVASKAVTKLTDSPEGYQTGYNEYTPAWSPDRKTIAISSMRSGNYDIWLVDPNGGGYQQNLTSSDIGIDGYHAFSK